MSLLQQFPTSRYTLEHPLCDGAFHCHLESCESVGAQTGWQALHFGDNHSILPGYLKQHSYGEYIFDWEWAEFYEKNKLAYYPKLVHALPFTPINSPCFFGKKEAWEALALESFQFYQEHGLSGEHYLFINDEEWALLKELGFAKRYSLQYHFQNYYTNFDDFLDSLTSSRRKNIKKERKKVSSYELTFTDVTGNEISQEILADLYALYLTTVNKKCAYAYLT